MKLVCCLAMVIVTVFAYGTPALMELKRGNLQFSANTYRELAEANEDQNFVVCPLSMQLVLALVEAGAVGKTAEQIITGLNLPDTEEKIHEAFKLISSELNVDDKYVLSSANKIYLGKNFTIKSDFKNLSTEIFNAEITDIEFTENIPAAAEINKWVLEKTHNRTGDLVSPDDLDEFTQSVLINAFYYRGRWIRPFNDNNTLEKSFKVNNVNETKVKMMEQTNRFNYMEDTTLDAKFLEMHYNGGALSMVFVLPNDIDGFLVLEENIEEVLKIPNYRFERVHVQIPHVHLEQKIDFIEILKKFGVTDPFDTNADFSRLKENNESLVINKIVQKAFIDIKEEGTTATSDSSPSQGTYDLNSSIEEFEANHPFLFILKSLRGILCVGRFVDPGNS